MDLGLAEFEPAVAFSWWRSSSWSPRTGLPGSIRVAVAVTGVRELGIATIRNAPSSG